MCVVPCLFIASSVIPCRQLLLLTTSVAVSRDDTTSIKGLCTYWVRVAIRKTTHNAEGEMSIFVSSNVCNALFSKVVILFI